MCMFDMSMTIIRLATNSPSAFVHHIVECAHHYAIETKNKRVEIGIYAFVQFNFLNQSVVRTEMTKNRIHFGNNNNKKPT